MVRESLYSLTPQDEVLVEEILREARRRPQSPHFLSAHLFYWAYREHRVVLGQESRLSLIYWAVDSHLLEYRWSAGDGVIPEGHEPRYWWTFRITEAGRAWLARRESG